MPVSVWDRAACGIPFDAKSAEDAKVHSACVTVARLARILGAYEDSTQQLKISLLLESERCLLEAAETFRAVRMNLDGDEGLTKDGK